MLRSISNFINHADYKFRTRILHQKSLPAFDPVFEAALNAACQQSGPQPLRFWIVRHGQSLGNVDFTAHDEYGDPGLPLTNLGVWQAQAAGKFLRETFDAEITWKCRNRPDVMDEYIENLTPILLAHSPYIRARHTANEIYYHIMRLPTNHKEILSLAEQSYGVWDGMEENDYKMVAPHAHKAWTTLKNTGQKFYAKNADGESPFDVVKRQRNDALPTVFRHIKHHDYNDIIIVCHGATVRALAIALTGGNEKTWNSMTNPPNGGIYLIKQIRHNNPEQDEAVKFIWENKGLVFDPSSVIKDFSPEYKKAATIPDKLLFEC